LTRMPTLRRLATFATVGAATTIGYAVIAEGLAFFGLRPVLASLIAYAICGCGSYLGHKRFTFASMGLHSAEAPRFFVATIAGLFVALTMRCCSRNSSALALFRDPGDLLPGADRQLCHLGAVCVSAGGLRLPAFPLCRVANPPPTRRQSSVIHPAPIGVGAPGGGRADPMRLVEMQPALSLPS